MFLFGLQIEDAPVANMSGTNVSIKLALLVALALGPAAERAVATAAVTADAGVARNCGPGGVTARTCEGGLLIVCEVEVVARVEEPGDLLVGEVVVHVLKLGDLAFFAVEADVLVDEPLLSTDGGGRGGGDEANGSSFDALRLRHSPAGSVVAHGHVDWRVGRHSFDADTEFVHVAAPGRAVGGVPVREAQVVRLVDEGHEERAAVVGEGPQDKLELAFDGQVWGDANKDLLALGRAEDVVQVEVDVAVSTVDEGLVLAVVVRLVRPEQIFDGAVELPAQ